MQLRIESATVAKAAASACAVPSRTPDAAATSKDRGSGGFPTGLFAEAHSEQPCDLPETLEGQTRLGEVEGERAPPYRGEARGQ